MSGNGAYKVQIEEGGAEAAALLVYELRNMGFTVAPDDGLDASSNGFQVAPSHIGTVQSLVENSAFTQAFLDQVADPVLACDAQGRLRLLNETARHLHPSPEEPLYPEKWGSQLSLYQLGEENPLGQDETPLIRALKGEEVRDQPLIIQEPGQEPREGLSSARAIYNRQGELLGAVALFRDLTEQRRAERALARQVELYEALSETNQFLVTDPDPQATFEAICRILVEHGGFKLAWVGLPDESGRIRPAAAYGAAREYLDQLVITTDPDRPEGQGPTGVALREGKATISRRILEDPAMSPWLEAAQAHGLRSSGAFPIHRGGQVVAALNVYAADPDFLDDSLMHLLDELVLDISYALDNHDRKAHARRMQTIVEASPDLIGVADIHGWLIYNNPAARQLLEPQLITGHIAECHPDWAARKVEEEGLPQAAAHGTWQDEIAFLDAEGREIPFSQTIIAHRDENGNLERYSTIARDMRPWHEAQEHIHLLTYHNPVTGLPNRAFMRERLESETGDMASGETRGAIILLDLDSFQAINDSLGNQRGDRVLASLADRLRRAAGQDQLVAHLGGDEFGVLFLGGAGSARDIAQQAESAAECLQTALAEPLTVDDRTLYPTASIGVALLGAEEEVTADGTLQKAGAALEQAKGAGAGTVRLAEYGLVEAARRRLDLGADLRRALAREELHPVFQPIWNVDGEHLAGFECLARWHHPDRGPISPGEFIPLAEETGLIHDLGSWVLEQAADFLTAVDMALPAWVSVNVSPTQFSRADFTDEVMATLRRRGLPGASLKLEITENLLMQNLATASDKMRQVRDNEVGFALDDFGTGFSSLAYLSSLPLDTLKIDRAIVGELQPGASQSPPVVDSIVSLGANLGMDIVAEGVEHHDQRVFLQGKGGILGQGFLWQPPLSRGDALGLAEGGARSSL